MQHRYHVAVPLVRSRPKFSFPGPLQHHLRFLSQSKTRSLLFAALEDNDNESPSANESEITSESSSLSSSSRKAQDGKEHMFDPSKTSPLWCLHAHYLHSLDTVISKTEHFKSKMVQYRNKKSGTRNVAWTSAFTSPQGVEVPAGTYRHDSRTCYRPTLQDENLPQNMAVYARRSDADSAAAARALDYIQFLSTGRTEPRFCEEDPVDLLLSQKTETGIICPSHLLVREHYLNLHNIVVSRRKQYNLQSKDFPDEVSGAPRTLHTATFTCPLSQTEYTTTQDLLESAQVKDSDGKLYYSKKGDAKRAVAMVVLDHLFGHLPLVASLSVSTPHPTVPVTSHEYATIAATRTEEYEGPVSPSYTPSIEDDVSSDEESDSSDTDHDETSKEDLQDMKVDGDDVDDDGYIISHSVQEFGSSPIEDLLEQGIHEAPTIPADVNEAMHLANSVAMSGAQRFSPHRLNVHNADGSILFARSKTALRVLSRAVQATPPGTAKQAKGAARSILKQLWESNVKPDTEMYTLYLKCMDFADASQCAAVAERIVASMIRRENNQYTNEKLPPPDIETMNALISLTAQQGGPKGRSDHHLGEDFEPHKISFLSVLSSATYQPVGCPSEFSSGFDPEFAIDCIERMSELSEELSDETLRPDVHVYNAPLRWAGGRALWSQSRAYARYTPWDDYQDLYRKRRFREYRPADYRLLVEAELAQEWLEKMEKLGSNDPKVAPNIETYEAVIQAWLRTSCREGLDRAERTFERIINKLDVPATLEPRTETLHPLLATRLYFADPSSNEKILDLLSRWRSICETRDMSYDPRFVELEMYTLWATHGRKLIRNTRAKEDSEVLASEVHSMAIKSNEILADVRNTDSPANQIETNLMNLNLRTWWAVALTGDHELIKQAVQEADGAASRIVEILVTGINDQEVKFGSWTGRLTKGASSEALSCLGRSHVVLSACIMILDDSCTLCHHDQETWENIMSACERAVRLMAEVELFMRIHEEETGQPWEEKGLEIHDDFVYDLQFATGAASRSDTVKQLLQFLDNHAATIVEKGFLASDAIRICEVCESTWRSALDENGFRRLKRKFNGGLVEGKSSPNNEHVSVQNSRRRRRSRKKRARKR